MALICRTLVSQPSLWHRLIAILITKLHSENIDITTQFNYCAIVLTDSELLTYNNSIKVLLQKATNITYVDLTK